MMYFWHRCLWQQKETVVLIGEQVPLNLIHSFSSRAMGMDGWMDGRTAEKENINFIKENNIKSTQVF
jgi:hypothetical protein